MERNKQLVFIVGSGRSGTTLLRNILEKHPKINVSPELKFFDVILANRQKLIFFDHKTKSERLVQRICEKYKQSEDPLWKKFNLEESKLLKNLDLSGSYRDIFLKIWGYFSTNPGAPIWIEKTPSNVFFLDNIIRYFSQAKIINMVRDGREVVASAKKRNWAENTLELAIWWKESVNAFYKWKTKRKSEYLEIKYENLVTNLEGELGKVFNFLNLSIPDKSFLNSLKEIESFSSFFESSKRGVYQSSHFRDFFSDKEQRIIESVISRELSMLGYKLYFERGKLLFSFKYLFLLWKIRFHLLSRRLGLFWVWSYLGKIIGRITK
ncbi:hypothetical protein A3F19_01755 [Candidatus Nomurabacteria bacterium RIFCSPHIGHO2_12_FULL_37_29]|uniref:Sulfotransferase domain-containing protein n=2 Tax=Parcubacteria group TaxID=1794811 RepID=A0A1G2UN95_9BACT|nr:MAG: hypothetical protein A3F19_01755 [Candidatus Nomurabacteria bacterium RIFCSPHIGHO2_12_FULL_37_29]OHB10871.1 MAG: hypothetical protein A3H60_01960 [Candidatus Zambryskibacteria bacterium RIFCSPLOWO2_02_FULL_44_12b]